jgi:kynurenine formamidase
MGGGGLVDRQRMICYSRVVDLSHRIDPEMPRWEGDPTIDFDPIAQITSEGYYLRRFAMGEHSGTHMNAPNSFFADASGIDGYPPECLVMSACVIDQCAKAELDSDYVLSIEDVLAWEAVNGEIPAGSLVVLFTGWQFRWHKPSAFLNYDEQGMPHFPGFSEAATLFLLTERSIAGVGIDTHGVDAGQDATYATNRAVLAQQGIVLECLTNLEQLPPTGTTLTIGILRLKEGSGSPASVLAFVP